jgi:hypothetical protein
MWRVGFRIFSGIFVAAVFTNALAVYVLHDIDADRVGKLNLAYAELTLEFLFFALVATTAFLVAIWVGAKMLRLQVVDSGLRLGFTLGIILILIQYPVEFIIRKLSTEHSSDSFLLAYPLLAPLCCAAIVVRDAHRQRSILRTTPNQV